MLWLPALSLLMQLFVGLYLNCINDITWIKNVEKFISYYFTDLFLEAFLQIVVSVAKGMVEGEINEGGGEGKKRTS